MSTTSSTAPVRKRLDKRQALLLCACLLALVTCGPEALAQSRPQLVPAGRKYQDKGLKPATGRSGSVSLTARALMGRDGKSLVEMTTGEFDAQAPPPGNINRAQLKPLDENGEALYARNFTGLTGGGYFRTTQDDLQRGQQVQAQANIGG